MDPYKALTTHIEAKQYLAEKEIPQLFESMLTGLMYSRPADPLEYLEECINKTKETGVENIMWDTFALKKDPLPPIASTSRHEQNEVEEVPPESPNPPPSSLNPFITLPPIANQGVEEETLIAESSATGTGFEDNSLPPPDYSTASFGASAASFVRESSDPVFISFIGGVGSGHEDSFPTLRKDYGLEVLQLGNLMQTEVESSSEVGNEIRTHMELGNQVPEETLLQVIQNAISKLASKIGYVLVGFPTTTELLQKFESMIGGFSLAVYFEQTDEELQQKIEESTNSELAAEDVQSFRSTTTPLLEHFRSIEILITIPSSDSLDEGTSQTLKLKDALGSLGFVVKEEPKLKEAEAEAEAEAEDTVDPKEQVEEEEIVAVEDTTQVGVQDSTLPPEAPSQNETASFLSIIGSSTSDAGKWQEYLQEKFGVSILEVGELMRSEVEKETPIGLALKSLMLQFKDIPDDLCVAIVLGAVQNCDKKQSPIVLRGFPRSEKQLSSFETTAGPISVCFSIDQSDDEMKEALKAADSQLDDEKIEQEVAEYKNHSEEILKVFETAEKLIKIPTPDKMDESVEATVAKVMSDSLKSCIIDAEKLEIAIKEAEKMAVELNNTVDASELTSVFETLPVVFVTGGPGSGKGTQCEKIVSSFNFTHLSSGDLLRAKVASGSADGQELDAIMKAGKLVPLEKVLDLITEAMVNAVNSGNCKGFLIDGYPREIEQGIKFEERIKPCSLVIDFDVPDEVMVQRLLKRGETSGRLDDNEETIRARLNTYREATVPVAAHYDSQSKLVRIDANRSVEEVFDDVKAAFQSKGIAAAESISQPIFFIVGGPGSGKGTQCEKMVAEFSFTHLSSGDLLRAEVASGSPKGQELQQEMAEGKLTSTETVLGLMKAAMEKEKAVSKGYLIDGYPRNVEQGEKFEQIVSPCAACISLELPPEVMKERLLKRGETSGRVDDNEETIQKRLETFDKETKPVLEYYKENGKLNSIDANRSPDEIYQDVRTVITQFVQSG